MKWLYSLILAIFLPVQVFACQFASSTLTADPDLMAYYKLENANATTGTNLTNTNSVTFSSAKYLNGADFNGSTQDLSTASTNVYKPTGTFTISTWIKYTSTATFKKMIWDGTTTGGNIYCASIGTGDSAGELRALVWNGSLQVLDTTTTYNDGNWHYVVLLDNGTNIKLYVDNVEKASVASGTGIAYSANTYFMLGGANEEGSKSQHLAGSLDDLTIFNRNLTVQEIDDIWTSDTTTPSSVCYITPPTPPGGGSTSTLSLTQLQGYSFEAFWSNKQNTMIYLAASAILLGVLTMFYKIGQNMVKWFRGL